MSAGFSRGTIPISFVEQGKGLRVLIPCWFLPDNPATFGLTLAYHKGYIYDHHAGKIMPRKNHRDWVASEVNTGLTVTGDASHDTRWAAVVGANGRLQHFGMERVMQSVLKHTARHCELPIYELPKGRRSLEVTPDMFKEMT